jgi:hypothetical protein
MGKHDSLLFPSRRQHTANYSPLAQFSSLTLQEHEETLHRLNLHKDMIVRAFATLAEDEAEATRRHHQTLSELARDESDSLERLAAAKVMIDSLYLKESQERSDTATEASALEKQIRELEDEGKELEVMEIQLKEMEEKYLRSIAEIQERKSIALAEADRSLTLLERARQASRVAATQIGRFGAAAPSATVVAQAQTPKPQSHTSLGPIGVTTYQPTASPRRPISPSRGGPALRSVSPSKQSDPFPSALALSRNGAVSPTQRGKSALRDGSGLSTTQQVLLRESQREKSDPFSTMTGSRPMLRDQTGEVSIPPKSFVDSVRGSPKREKTVSYDDPNNSAVNRTSYLPKPPMTPTAGYSTNASTTRDEVFVDKLRVAESGPATGTIGGRTALHVACASTFRDVDSILELLREQPELVDALDDAGNTPLHAACSASEPSLEVVHALLLSGSSTTVKNEDGFTPFHLACLNPGDRDHKLKKFLIFKGAQNPNQRTSRGETAAHLLATHDRHFDSLRYLTSVGLDLNVSALLPAEKGQPAKRMTPVEIARANRLTASKCCAFLEAHRDNGSSPNPR